MNTLLLRLAGPMQSWGTQSRFGNRDTGLEPSKSGVIGLLCCALGWQRDSESFAFESGLLTIEQFARSFKMTVRVDCEGRMSRDYHTAQNVLRSDRSGQAPTVLSERFYLADAEFIVGLSCNLPGLLEQLDRSLRSPVWPLCLGRKSFVPGLPIPLGVSPDELLKSLADVPRIPRPAERWQGPPERLRIVEEVPDAHGEEVRQDVPICFVSQRRQFTTRNVRTWFLPDLDHDLPMPPMAKGEA